MKRRRVPNITPERWAYLKALQWNPITDGRFVHVSAPLQHFTDAAGIARVVVLKRDKRPGMTVALGSTYRRPIRRTQHRAAA